MPIFILALSQATNVDVTRTILSFLIIHLLVYPSSNGYNSYIDRDVSPIGGLENPPMPTKQLFYLTIAIDVLAILLSAFTINVLFSVCILLYILASRAYSSRQIRLKKYPFVGFFVVVVFQGGFTFLMCSIGISNSAPPLNISVVFIMIACSLQIAGAYPLTQIYQHESDLKDGVTTLSCKLGYKGTFAFTASMFALCNFFYYLYFNLSNKQGHFLVLQIYFLPIVLYFIYWLLKILKDSNNANFKHTMLMNAIASVCMSLCFITLFILNIRQ